MGHTVSREVISSPSNQSSSQNLSVDSISESFEIIYKTESNDNIRGFSDRKSSDSSDNIRESYHNIRESGGNITASGDNYRDCSDSIRGFCETGDNIKESRDNNRGSSDNIRIGNMSVIRRQTGNRSLVKTWSSEIKTERKLLEEKHTELNKVLLGFQHCMAELGKKENEDEKFFSEINKLLKDKVIGKFSLPQFSSDEQREVMGNKLAEIGFVTAALSYYKFILEEEDIDAVTNPLVQEARESQDAGPLLIMTIREIFWNFSDSSYYFGEKLADTDLFDLLMGDLKYILKDSLEQLQLEDDIFAFSSAVGILHNCARNPDIDKEKFRKVGAIKRLPPFLYSSISYVKMITLLALANMIKEDQVTLLDADIDVFDFVFKAVIATWEDKNDRTKGYGFSLAELIDGLASLARSEQNKKLIMEKQPLDLMCEIMNRSDVDVEKLSAVKFIWELAFLDENKEKIVKHKGIKKILTSLKDHPDPDLKKTARGACFVLFEKDRLVQEETPAPEKAGLRRRSSTKPKKEGKHIMISYQWTDQQMVLKIAEALKVAGYPIWIDVDQMAAYENVLEGMANAVEDAYLVLICFSERYKESQNCRTEGEFCFTRQKEFIALKMQRGYTPDGWLGALIGAKLFIEFSHKHPFEESIEDLKKRIEDKHFPTEFPLEPTSPISPTPSTPKVAPVEKWKKEDVNSWLVKHKLTQKAFARVKLLSGPQIAFLGKVYRKAPETFFRWLEEKLLLKELEDIRIVTMAIEDLVDL